MTITLDISPEMESDLRTALARQDMSAAQQLLAGVALPQLETLLRRGEGEEAKTMTSRQARALDRESREARDLEIINRHADALNREAEDFLTFQADW
jgi:hypothetical protein